MFYMEFGHLVWGIGELIRVLPGVLLHPIALPFDQVLKFSAEHPAVQDFFDDIFFFAIDEFGGRWRVSASTNDGVFRRQGQLYHIKHWVESFHRRRED